MVRLIDADYLAIFMAFVDYAEGLTAKQAIQLVKEADEIDAIPVDWLKEHYSTNQVYGTEQYFRTAYAVQDILAEWERTRKEE